MLAIVQARFSSKRLPGKVLRPLAGRPLLGWLVARLNEARLVSKTVIATSTDTSDDAVAEFAASADVECFRGSLDDVAGRLLAAAQRYEAQAFVRINGDSPFTMPSLVDAVIESFVSQHPDLATNVQLRTFPKGFSVEVIRTASLGFARKLMQAGDKEHVTPVFYRRPDKFQIVNVVSGHDWGSVQLSVDDEDDFTLAQRMMQVESDDWTGMGIEELLALRERCLVRVPS